MIHILNVLIFLIIPLFWIGLIRSYLSYRRRLKSERKQFQSAIDARNQETGTYLLALVVLGIVGSIISFLFGAEVSLSWIVVYELIAAVVLLIPGVMMPILTFFASVLIVFIMGLPQVKSLLPDWRFSTHAFSAKIALNYFALEVLLVLLTFVFLKLNVKAVNSPKIKKNVRNNRYAAYRFNRFSVFPLLLFVPGSLIHDTLPFWPVFNVFGVSMTFLVIPFFVGVKMNFVHHLPYEIISKLANSILMLGMIGVLGCLFGYYFQNLAIALGEIVVLTAFYFLILWHFKRNDKKTGTELEQEVDGVRIIGIKHNSPAEKMGLKVGDLILNINGQPVRTEKELYKALQTDSTYCRIKIKNRHGQIEIKETALFSGSPHEIGIEMFEEN